MYLGFNKVLYFDSEKPLGDEPIKYVCITVIILLFTKNISGRFLGSVIPGAVRSGSHIPPKETSRKF